MIYNLIDCIFTNMLSFLPSHIDIFSLLYTNKKIQFLLERCIKFTDIKVNLILKGNISNIDLLRIFKLFCKFNILDISKNYKTNNDTIQILNNVKYVKNLFLIKTSNIHVTNINSLIVSGKIKSLRIGNKCISCSFTSNK